MRRPTRRDERGIVGVILTIVIVFALIAVVELTRTLEAAQQINTTVMDITGSVSEANSHLSTGCAPPTPAAQCSTALPVLSTTESLAAQIADAAKPLNGQAGQILDSVNSINATASQILTNATSINGTVHSINGAAGSINASVNSIGGSLNGVNADVVNIQGGVAAINNRADTIIGLVNGIKGDTSNINAQAGSIRTQATGICNAHILGLVGLGTSC